MPTMQLPMNPMNKFRSKRNADMAAAYWGKSLDKPDWYRMETNGDNAEILIYDIIGWPFIEAEQFVRDLDKVTAKEILVRINSPGGSVFEGMAIYNALKSHKARIVTRVDSLAASMASVIALAGDEVQAYRNSMFMIHEPWGLAIGNQHELREMADVFAKINDNMCAIYAAKTGLSDANIREMVKSDTYLKASEALDKGFFDKIIDDNDDEPEAQARGFEMEALKVLPLAKQILNKFKE